MIAIPKSRKNSKKNVEVSEPIPKPDPAPVPVPVVAEKPPSYRQRLIEKVGIEEVRNRERASRLATKERKALKAQAIPVS